MPELLPVIPLIDGNFKILTAYAEKLKGLHQFTESSVKFSGIKE